MNNNAIVPMVPRTEIKQQSKNTTFDDVLAFCCALCDAAERAQTPADDVVITKVGRVTALIGPNHMGEVRLSIRGGSEDYLAISSHPEDVYNVNDSVIVIGLHLPRTVIVRKI